ncbi:FimV family protein [Caenimonas koreensis]|uniref:Tfp pilus assembly protein FimV n=1 Tax=Caenimonas koreensis DSM 17982 TaxID=1121255 RepID=A0A844B123_9BURK|nr:hypothetical protein [Caenimonas koreensis]MRD48418.1 hypothetical protein [Caenimonas koreensis DSM 17982]
MNRSSILRNALLRAGLLLAAPASFAFGTGAAEGVPLIGRPLDIVVPITLDAGTDLASSCVTAEVMQGDTAIESAQTRVEGGGSARTVLRVRTTRLIEEPVVTVTVNFGCFLRTSRKFVLLADLPATVSSPIPPLVPRTQAAAGPTVLPFSPGLGGFDVPAGNGAQPGPASSTTRRRATAPGAEAPAAGARPAAGSMSPRLARAPNTPAAGQDPAVASPTTAAPAPAKRSQASVVRVDRRSRLKLEPLDLTVDPEPKLKLTMSIDTVPEVTPQKRAEAAAIWRALNRSQADVVQDYERLQAMSADLTAMRQSIQANKAELDAVRAKLEKAESDRDRMTWLLTAIVIALVLALAAALFLRRRGWFAGGDKSEPRWWRDSKGQELDASEPTIVAAAAPASSAVSGKQLDVDLDVFGDAPASAQAPASTESTQPISAFDNLDFQSSQPSSWRSLTTEELHDIQEQADFFVSLGDYDRAVNVLMTHVHASPHNSALAWMALLDLHHRLNRERGYEGLRDQIERRMNVKVPAFNDYLKPTAGLEAYADALARIVSLWPSPRVLDVIEESIYRLPGAASGESERFELAAFDELLLLQSLAKAVVKQPAATDVQLAQEPGAGENFPMTSIQPLSSELAGPSDAEMMVLATLLAGSRIDINLDEEEKPVATLPTLPELPKGAPLHDAQGWPVADDKDNLIEFDDFDDVTSRVGKK